MTGGGLVTVAASSSVLVCTVDVLAVVAAVAQLELMDLKMESSFSVQNPPIRSAGWSASCSRFAKSSCVVVVFPRSPLKTCCILS